MNRYQIIDAAHRSLELGRPHMQDCTSDNPSLDWDHLISMRDQMDAFTDEGKLNRWLGWIQAAVVAGCFGEVTLEQMKEINKA